MPRVKVSASRSISREKCFFFDENRVEKDRKIQLQHGLSVEIYGFDVAGMRIIRYLHALEVFIERSRFIFNFTARSFFS